MCIDKLCLQLKWNVSINSISPSVSNLVEETGNVCHNISGFAFYSKVITKDRAGSRELVCKNWIFPVMLAQPRPGHTPRLRQSPPNAPLLAAYPKSCLAAQDPNSWPNSRLGRPLRVHVTHNKYGFAKILDWPVHLGQPWETRHPATGGWEIASAPETSPPITSWKSAC